MNGTDTLKIPTKPTCRYGHGELVDVNQLHGAPVNYGLVMYLINEPTKQPQFLNGLKWFVCKTCGYSELQDSDTAQTFSNMRDQP